MPQSQPARTGSNTLAVEVRASKPWKLVLGTAALASLVLVAGSLVAPSRAGAEAPEGAPSPVALGAAAPYSVLGNTSVTSAGATVVYGDLGVSPGTAVVGFPPAVVHGVIDAGDANAAAAQTALSTAYSNAAALTPTAAIAGDQNGVTLDAGVYAASAAVALTGTMTLDGQGNPAAVFVFQINAALSTAAASDIHLIGDAQASNVFWQVNGAASMGASASFSGTIMAMGAITLGAGASLDGRALSSAAVTLSDNAVTMPPGPPTVTISSPVIGSTYLVGQSVPTSFTCVDPTGPGIATCTDGSGSVSPGALDTSAVGNEVYTVTATSSDGQTTSGSIGYTVVTADTVTFVSAPKSALTTTTTDSVLAGGPSADHGGISYSSTTPLVCGVSPSSGALDFLTFGNCTIMATQAADAADRYASGTAVTTITVTIHDTVNFVSPTPNDVVTTTDIDTVLASGASGDNGAFNYSSKTPAICAVQSTSGALRFVAVGTCTIEAAQAADGTDGYLSATAQTNITVDARDVVTFLSPPTSALTTTTTDAVLAMGTPGDEGAVSYSSVTPSVCRVDLLTGTLSFSQPGYCIIEASQSADSTDGYTSGTAEMSITVNPAGVAKPLPSSAVVGIAAASSGGGYWVAMSNGVVEAFNNAPNYGSATGPHARPIVGIVATPDGKGYWLVTSDGLVFGFGDAHYHGSLAGVNLNKPIVAVTSTPDGGGYWMVATDGGIFSFGDAKYQGSMGGIHLNEPIVGMAVDRATGGYWLVASDGGIFAFDAKFLGSTGNIHLTRPIIGMEAANNGSGYRLVASDGGIFCFHQPYSGSLGAQALESPVTGVAATPDAAGYWLVQANGKVSPFGDA
jgi:hypothetical protein